MLLTQTISPLAMPLRLLLLTVAIVTPQRSAKQAYGMFSVLQLVYHTFVHSLTALSLSVSFSRRLFRNVQLVELKNGSTFNGHLVACDNFMNLTLREVYETSAVRPFSPPESRSLPSARRLDSD